MASREYQKGFLAAVRYVGTRLRAQDTKGINYELELVTLNARHGIFPPEEQTVPAPRVAQQTEDDDPAFNAESIGGHDGEPVPRAPIEQKPKRTRRTSAQIAADRAQAAESKAKAAAGMSVVDN